MAVSNISWRVLRRARMNQGVVADMYFSPFIPDFRYIDEYSYVPILGLSVIDMNLMMGRAVFG
jgi:hypothetical protein